MERDYNIPQEQESDTQLIPIIKTCYHIFKTKWYWFLLSTILCLAIGYVYQQRKVRTYQRQAVMLIENSESSGTGGSTLSSSSRRSRSNMNSLLELNGISVGDNLKNEMFILSSERLMRRVVDTLGLTLDMTTKHALHMVPLYKQEPLLVMPSAPTEKPVAFMMSIDEGGKTVRLWDFQVERDEYNTSITVPIGKSVRTPAGTFTITKGETFDTFPRGQEIQVTYFPVELAARVYKNSISAEEYDKESSLIVLSCQDTSPQRAEDILMAVYNAYKQDVVDNKNRVANNTARFINSRLTIIGEELSEAENRLASFKQQSGLIDFRANASAFTNEMMNARKQTIELETQLSIARYLKEFLQDNSNATDLIPSLDLAGAGVSTQIAAYNQLMNERNKTAANSSDSSPLVREADTRLAAMRSNILHSVNSYVRTTEIEVAAARSTESQANSQMAGAPIQEKLGLDMQRQQTLKEALYTYLLNKREEVTLQLAINEANVRMVEEPLGSNLPTAPKKRLILTVSFFVGLLIPALIFYLMLLFDVTISNRSDVEAATTIPVVGELPHWADATRGKLISECDSDAPIVEAFRMLRYSLNFIDSKAKVIVLTSSTPSHGKSFISKSLGIIFGMARKRVLIIDADIRKRTLSRGISRHGLTSLLADEDGATHLQDAIVHDHYHQGVDFLPAGMLPPNPAELLMSERFDEIIAEARAQYDYVIVDTTPMLAVADAGIVDRVADLTLFVMRVGVQEKAFLPELEKDYKDGRFKHLCVVLNDADTKSRYGNYRYGYGYGYRYEGKDNA